MIDGQPFDAGQTKPANLRILAKSPKSKDFFDRIGSGANIRLSEISSSVGNKLPFIIFSYAGLRGKSKPFSLPLQPACHEGGLFDIESHEVRVLPFEVQTRPLNS
jgi:hypothetical protein